MERAWRLKDVDEGAAALLGKELGVHPATARCLVGRGLSDAADAGRFLGPRLVDLRPPAGMAGFEQAVARLTRAVRGGERIGIFGDYDVDGVTTTALLTTFLGAVGAQAAPRVARRDAGYGFGEADAAWFAGERCRLIVTVDCGTSDVAAIRAARAHGIDVIVVDHHQVPGGGEHPAHALLNPHRPDSTYPFRGLASVGLGFFVAAAARTALRQAGWFASRSEPDVRRLLDLVAVGTIADLAPLTHENRVLVSHGLRELSQRGRPGLAALLARAGVEGDRAVDEIDVGWKLGPRLNAPGRLGDARPSLDLLLAADDREAAARVAVCEEANERRRVITTQMADEAIAEARDANDAAIVVARAGWHPGVAGIVAAKLVERFGKPAAVIAIDEAMGQGRGSVRTVDGFDLVRALGACREHLIRFGGHAQAAGLTVASDKVALLRRAFAAQAAAGAIDAGPSRVEVDAILDLGDVDEKVAGQFRALAPFGPGNDAPIVAAPDARVTGTRRVGEDGSHLRLTLECSRWATSHSAIAFRMGERDPGAGSTVDLAYCPGISQWRGVSRVELRVTDFWPIPP
jgi:single-stranded-DNA-specific exonuclease